MAAVPPVARVQFGSDLSLAQTAQRNAVGLPHATSQANTWSVWTAYCEEVGIDPLLETAEDPIPYLQVFAQQYRDGRIAKDGNAVRSRTVEDALRAISQTVAGRGARTIA